MDKSLRLTFLAHPVQRNTLGGIYLLHFMTLIVRHLRYRKLK